MTARPPRASTKGDGRRPKPRGATQSDRDRVEQPHVDPQRLDRRRAASVVPTDRYEAIEDDEVVEETERRDVPQLRLLVLEGTPHLAAAQAAIAAAGHRVVVGATGRDAIERLRSSVGDVDALLVGLPGGEAMIDAVLSRGSQRPVVIAASTSGAVDAARRAVAAGADLATVRPHDVERLAPILLAAARLLEQRRRVAGALAPEAGQVAEMAEMAELDELGEPDPRGLQPFERFERAVEHELARARRYAYPLAVAMFSVDLPPPEPPPGVRGILRARAGNALVHAIRDIDLATELDQDRFLVLLPHTDRLAGAELARRIISAVASCDPVIAGGRAFPPKVIGAVAGARPGAPLAFAQLVQDATQLLEQAQATGASLAVEP